MIRARYLAFALAGLLAGCVTTYEDDGAGSTNAAVVRYDHPIAAGVLIEAIDGQRPGVRLVREYRLVPGIHSFRARAESGGYHSSPETRWFDAAPGGRYRIDTVVDHGDASWGFAIYDERTGVRVDRAWSRQDASSGH